MTPYQRNQAVKPCKDWPEIEAERILEDIAGRSRWSAPVRDRIADYLRTLDARGMKSPKASAEYLIKTYLHRRVSDDLREAVAARLVAVLEKRRAG